MEFSMEGRGIPSDSLAAMKARGYLSIFIKNNYM